jgi:tRNA (mo5U34)-methyltransferase
MDPSKTTSLREEMDRLGPWGMGIDVTPDLSTEPEPDPTYKPREPFKALLSRAYPDGLQGRSVLDCACNCGAFLFWAKELGASECFGFDIRRHWIDQARFLLEHRPWPSEGMRFEVRDLYELPDMKIGPFDVTVFNGIFYHLPDPVRGLKVAADLTNELIIVNTATYSGHEDGFLAVQSESTEQLLSGVYGLNWLPTGPEVIRQVLSWTGFEETRVLSWEEEIPATPGSGRLPGWGRLSMVGSKTPSLLGNFNQSSVEKLFRKLNDDPAHVIRAYSAPGFHFDVNAQEVQLQATRRRQDKVLARIREKDVRRWWVFTFDNHGISNVAVHSDREAAAAALEA